MIGVFDSGDGGLSAVAEIRRIAPNADIVFFADRQNAPYGTKTKKELIRLVCADIIKLSKAGADKILMACCTASTVHPFLPRSMQKIALPIIELAAAAGSDATKNGRIGVIATDYTVASGAFSKALSKHMGITHVYEQPMQTLVYEVESGVCDRNIKDAERARLRRMLRPMKDKKIDTLILGCTHFAHLEREIGNCLPNVKIINTSREGAKGIIQGLDPRGKGRTVYL